MGRQKTDKYDIETMCRILEEYTDNCIQRKIVPILKEVTVKNHWNYHYVTTLKLKREEAGDQRLSTCIKRLVDAKEYMLERKGLEGTIEKTMAIFSLKQLGWKDRQEVGLDEETRTALKINIINASDREDEEKWE